MLANVYALRIRTILCHIKHMGKFHVLAQVKVLHI
jgi:hypothetical protein